MRRLNEHSLRIHVANAELPPEAIAWDLRRIGFGWQPDFCGAWTLVGTNTGDGVVIMYQWLQVGEVGHDQCSGWCPVSQRITAIHLFKAILRSVEERRRWIKESKTVLNAPKRQKIADRLGRVATELRGIIKELSDTGEDK